MQKGHKFKAKAYLCFRVSSNPLWQHGETLSQNKKQETTLVVEQPVGDSCFNAHHYTSKQETATKLGTVVYILALGKQRQEDKEQLRAV